MQSKTVKIYAEHLERGALDQFNSAMEQDYAVRGALMPDAHTGYSLPIGAVVATEGVIVPSWVGYDIGCGMCAMPLAANRQGVEIHARGIFEEIYKRVPVGFNVNDTDSASCLDTADLTEVGRRIADGKNWRRAIGSLGGGNHFIEIGYDESDVTWVVVHSGSRGVGHGLATHYMKLASGTNKAKEGHHGLTTDSLAGQAYLNDMNWALDLALENRLEMVRRVASIVAEYTGAMHLGHPSVPIINRNHNHATVREVDNRLVWIHRKGATHAEEGMLGVIPGNMRDGSFIVEGRGNPDSLFSSSHGAGRVLGRKKAKEQIAMDDFEMVMRGVTARVTEATKDESPFAYKDIFDVMRLQEELVTVKHHIKPIINVKG